MDDTHGAQQLALFSAFYNEYGYQPLHIYEGQSGKLITTILRPGCRPTGAQIKMLLKRVVAYLGQAGNSRLKERVAPWLAQAQALSREQGKKVRLFTAFSYQAHRARQGVRVTLELPCMRHQLVGMVIDGFVAASFLLGGDDTRQHQAAVEKV